MDKGFLLVLLSLQAFLLIAAFTSTDAAALMRDPQLPPHLVKRSTMGRLRSATETEINGKEYWDIRPGIYHFALLERPAPPPPFSPPPPPRPEVLRMDRPGGRIID